ncbi:MAG: hypothetical protein U9R49_00580 [Bacteroidota bacterium]|nr:hypothetical protein [Bacteroidota bacterium]
MKLYFHFLFSCALLLGSLIVFNVQKPESLTLVSENPDIEHVELQAEINSNQTSASSVPSIRLSLKESFELVTGNLKHLEYLSSADHLARIKMQVLIHLEIKPVLGTQSGQDHHQSHRYEDPPLS